MIRFSFAPLVLAVFALAACNKSGDTSAPQASEAVKAVAPPAGTKWSDKVVVTDEGVRMGNPDAPIKLVEYGSLSCPHCAKLAQQGFAKLTGDYVGSGRVSYEFRSYVIHPQDVPLSLLAKCVPLETYFPMIEQIYANFDALSAPLEDKAVQDKANAALQGPPQDRMNGLADALNYTQFFAQRGLPLDKAHVCLADSAAAKKISDNTQKWFTGGINQTPTLYLNDTKLDVAEWDQVEKVLKDAGAR
jgi:protein-disulfide isomerase